MSLLSMSGIPGMGATVLSTENVFLWGADTWYLLKGIVIDSAATDSGSTPTTDLRPGLVLGQVTSTKRYKPYSATATTGEGLAEGVLFHGVRMLRPLDGVVDNQIAQLVVAGPVKGANLYGLDQLARAQMYGRFIFDDDLAGCRFGAFRQVVAKTANYTVTTADHDTLFTTDGAAGEVDFTLPACAPGLRFRFMNTAGQTMKVIAAAGKLIAFNNAAATSVALSTAGNLIGSGFEITPNSDASKWIAQPIGQGTVTVA